MSQKFEGAQPQIMRGKPKFKENRDPQQLSAAYQDQDASARETLNIMYDKRVFRGNTHAIDALKASQKNLTAAEKDEMRIKAQQEDKKIEMIKNHLQLFKKHQSKKTSPYDLSPGPMARIEVDLTYFLTEQSREKQPEVEVKTQTDEFFPRPVTPKYVPKKTGIDKITQIEDYDLFNYDREVQPILNVLLTKTVEQALMEVEEETELGEIRKFKSDYEKRQEDLHEAWDMEVKREIQRIKHKNKLLKQARAKRDQQIKTMHKLQCLQMSKSFLSGCFRGTMQHMVETSTWRDTLADQMDVSYTGHLLNETLSFTENSRKSSLFLNKLVDGTLTKIVDNKSKLAKTMIIKRKALQQSRMIESNDRRIVHFIFHPEQPVQVQRFSKELQAMFDGSLEAHRSSETEKFDAVVDRVTDDPTWEVTGNEWCELGESPFWELSLGNINNISFAVADNPFQKQESAKYYPEMIYINGEGDIVSRISPTNGDQFCEQFPSLKYEDGPLLRDDMLRINDDRKIKMKLDEFSEDPDAFMLLVVRSFDTRAKPFPEDALKQAWFRLINEDTAQTIDYTKIDSIQMPEDYAEGELPNPDDEDAEPVTRNEAIYIAGRLFRDCNLEYKRHGQPKWVYEKWSSVKVGEEKVGLVTTSERFPDLAKKVADQYKDHMKITTEQNEKLGEMTRSKNSQSRGGLMQKQRTRKPQAEGDSALLPPASGLPNVRDSVMSRYSDGMPDYNLEDPQEFGRALKERIGRPFAFGPIDLSNLNNSNTVNADNGVKIRQKVSKEFIKNKEIGEKDIALCQNGYKVLVKDRTWKRSSSMLKHARFMQNLKVEPIYPVRKVAEPEKSKDDDADEEE